MFCTPVRTVRKIIKVLNLSLNNIRCRDRIIKIIQYGSQMILGYYGDVLRRETVDMLEQAKILRGANGPSLPDRLWRPVVSSIAGPEEIIIIYKSFRSAALLNSRRFLIYFYFYF